MKGLQRFDFQRSEVFMIGLTCFVLTFELPHDKTNKMTVRPAKTQISLGIRPVWSVLAVRMKKAWVLSYRLSTQRRLWADADLSLRWAHSHFVGFVMRRLIFWTLFSYNHLGRVKRIWYLTPMRAAKVQASLRIRAVSPEPPLLAHTSSESRGTFRQKTRSLAPLNGWTCAVEICHDGMLEVTNSLDGAHFKFVEVLVWINVH